MDTNSARRYETIVEVTTKIESMNGEYEGRRQWFHVGDLGRCQERVSMRWFGTVDSIRIWASWSE